MLDINSAFPWAMTQNHWISPSGKYDIVKGAPKKNFDQSLISCRCLAGGSLPYRNSDKGVSFPENTYPLEFFCTGWEIRAGLETGAIKDLAINYSLTPRKTESFAAFVNYFYEMKKRAKAEGRKADEYHAKLFLNSCYGKMGLDISKFRDVAFRSYYDAPEEKGWEEHWHDERRGLSAYERPSSEGPRGKFSKFYCIAIAASVTGLVRAFLWRSIASVSGIQYCDTDSIICESPKKLQVGAELGEWKHEMDIDWLWIGGKKLYAAHDAEYPWLKCVPKGEKKKDYVNVKGLGFTKREAFKTAAKGVRLSIEKIISICEGSTREGKFDAPSYSANGIPRFTKRKIRRADKREI
jgi:hypothetical protein